MPHLAGEIHPAAKLTDENVREIKGAYRPGHVTQADLAEVHGVAKQTIAAIINGQTWRHIVAE